MAGKACVLASSELAFALDRMSKNTMIDLVVDRARAELGEDASDDEVADLLENWARPVFQARGDQTGAFRVRTALVKIREHDARCLRDHGIES